MSRSTLLVMQVESAPQALPRRRALAISPEGFRRIAIVATVALVLIVATGATVRLTGSGLGCEHWPGCQAGDPLPKKGYHSYVEFSNRIVAFLTVVATLALAIAAWATRSLARWVKVLATLVFVGTLGQARSARSRSTTTSAVARSATCCSLLVLGLGVLVVVEATRLVRGGDPPLPARPRGRSRAARCEQRPRVLRHARHRRGKYPGSSGDDRVHRLVSFQPSVAFHVRGRRVRHRLPRARRVGVAQSRALPWLVRGCGVLLAILAVQMVIGEVQYRTYQDVPWWLVLTHVTIAAALFGWTVGVVARLWRPVAPDRT